MGYYATSTATLNLREGVDVDALVAVVEEWDEGFNLIEVNDTFVDLGFSAKYRGVEDDLAQLLPFIAPGEYMTFVGEDSAVWRLRFDNDRITTLRAIFQEV